MRSAYYILILLFLISCNQGEKSDSLKNFDLLEEEVTATSYEVIPEAFEYQSLTIQKLQDYFDLLVLQQQHPEFKNEIHKQLVALSSDSTKIPLNTAKISIEEVQQIGVPEKISDSVQLLTVSFNVVTPSTTIKDTLVAKIVSKKVMVEGTEVTTTKLQFINKMN